MTAAGAKPSSDYSMMVVGITSQLKSSHQRLLALSRREGPWKQELLQAESFLQLAIKSLPDIKSG
jgi:hypothetical protein